MSLNPSTCSVSFLQYFFAFDAFLVECFLRFSIEPSCCDDAWLQGILNGAWRCLARNLNLLQQFKEILNMLDENLIWP